MCECEKVKSVNKRVLITSIHYFNMALGKKYYIKKTQLLYHFISLLLFLVENFIIRSHIQYFSSWMWVGEMCE